MGTLRAVFAAAALVLASPATAGSVADWRPYITEASARFGVPAGWIEAVMQAESRGRTTRDGRPIRSSTGAIGLMQLMSSTWAEMRARLGLGFDPDDPHDNILAGAFYLRLMYDRFGYPGMFAAYNAGPGRYSDHLARRRALPAETVRYLASVSPAARGATGTLIQPAPSSLFAVRKDVPADVGQGPSSALFVALSQED